MAARCPGMGGGATASAAAASFNDADIEFAQMMIPHHRQAAEMAALTKTRPKRRR